MIRGHRTNQARGRAAARGRRPGAGGGGGAAVAPRLVTARSPAARPTKRTAHRQRYCVVHDLSCRVAP